jgi:hypothetical protein
MPIAAMSVPIPADGTVTNTGAVVEALGDQGAAGGGWCRQPLLSDRCRFLLRRRGRPQESTQGSLLMTDRRNNLG